MMILKSSQSSMHWWDPKALHCLDVLIASDADPMAHTDGDSSLWSVACENLGDSVSDNKLL